MFYPGFQRDTYIARLGTTGHAIALQAEPPAAAGSRNKLPNVAAVDALDGIDFLPAIGTGRYDITVRAAASVLKGHQGLLFFEMKHYVIQVRRPSDHQRHERQTVVSGGGDHKFLGGSRLIVIGGAQIERCQPQESIRR